MIKVREHMDIGNGESSIEIEYGSSREDSFHILLYRFHRLIGFSLEVIPIEEAGTN
jgi:hypothetical protein